MPSIADIKHRIKSVGDTRQITKAMELISIAKMRKAIVKFESNLTYFEKVRATIKDILLHTPDIKHPFLRHRDGKRTAYIVIAGDKGMAGGYNKNVLELAWEHMQTRSEKYVFTVGQMARDFFDRKGQTVDVEFLHAVASPTLYDARRIASDIVNLYEKNLMDEVLVVYTKIKSSVSQTPRIIKLLPVELADMDDVDVQFDYDSVIEYDPSRHAVLETLVPQYIVGLMYATLVQSVASEQCMRMLSMGSATKNADKMLSELSLIYNRARQGQITDSLIEIVSASGVSAEAGNRL